MADITEVKVKKDMDNFISAELDCSIQAEDLFTILALNFFISIPVS